MKLPWLPLTMLACVHFGSWASAGNIELELAWSLSPGERTYLTTNDRQRGLAVHPTEDYVLLVHRAPLTVPILNAFTGAEEGLLSTAGVSEGNFLLNKIAIAEDGTIYACNMTVDTRNANFRLYRWANKDATPELVFDAALNSEDALASNRRFGDSLVVRGTGENTEILLNTWDGTIWARLSPLAEEEISDPHNQFAAEMIAVSGVVSGTLRDISPGDGNLFYGSASANDRPLYEIEFDPAAMTATAVRTFQGNVFPVRIGPVGLDVERGFLGGIHAWDSVFYLYRIDDLDENADGQIPTLASYPFSTNNTNTTRSGVIAFRGDMVYVLETNNGVLALQVIEIEPTPAQPGDLLWTNANAILGSDRSGSNPQTHATGLQRATGLAVDSAGNRIFYVDEAAGVIGRVHFDGSGQEDVISGRTNPRSIVLAGERMFWTEYWSGLWSATLDGSDVQQLISDSYLTGIAIDREAGKVYVSREWGELRRVDLDGSSLETLSNITLDWDSQGLALNSESGTLYATSFQSGGNITAFDLVSGQRMVLYSGRSYPLGIVLSEDGQQLFWVESPPGQANGGRILTAPAAGNGTVQEIASSLNNPHGVALVPPRDDTFASWIAQFDLPSALSGPLDDADGDGIANLLEYVLGGDPTVPNRALLPAPAPYTDNGDTFLSLTVNRSPEAIGVALLIEVSSDLVNWHSGAEHVKIMADEPGVLSARDLVPMADADRRFIRLRLMAE